MTGHRIEDEVPIACASVPWSVGGLLVGGLVDHLEGLGSEFGDRGRWGLGCGESDDADQDEEDDAERGVQNPRATRPSGFVRVVTPPADGSSLPIPHPMRMIQVTRANILQVATDREAA